MSETAVILPFLGSVTRGWLVEAHAFHERSGRTAGTAEHRAQHIMACKWIKAEYLARARRGDCGTYVEGTRP